MKQQLLFSCGKVYYESLKDHAPTRQLITPEDVAALIVFLGSPVDRQITGEVIRITGGR